jgi:hypothetical protein
LSRSNRLASRRFWLIVRHDVCRMEVLTTGLPSGEEALPVFSFEDEARMFLELAASDCWRVRETTAGELTSLLLGLCAGVERVVLDPLPGQFAQALMYLASMGREVFMESYSRKRGGLAVDHRSRAYRRQADVIPRRTTLERG